MIFLEPLCRATSGLEVNASSNMPKRNVLPGGIHRQTSNCKGCFRAKYVADRSEKRMRWFLCCGIWDETLWALGERIWKQMCCVSVYQIWDLIICMSAGPDARLNCFCCFYVYCCRWCGGFNAHHNIVYGTTTILRIVIPNVMIVNNTL